MIFPGGILSKFTMLNINDGKIENYSDIILNIDGYKYDLKPYELRIEFDMDKDKKSMMYRMRITPSLRHMQNCTLLVMMITGFLTVK